MSMLACHTSHTRWLEELNRDSLVEAGGKGANLGEMIHAGLPVPPGFVVTADAYRVHLGAGHLQGRIADRLQNLLAEDLAAVTAASEDIMGWIGTASMPDRIRADVASRYEALNARLTGRTSGAGALPVAVRSSATAEDLPSASFAGQQETYLNVREVDAVIEAVRQCWASLWTPQAISYRTRMNFDHLSVAMAVVVQALLPADAAGVMLTVNPVSGARDEIVISGSYGFGEAVVSGAVTPDTYILSQDGKVKERTLGGKEIRVVCDVNGTHTVAVCDAEQRRYCLSDFELAALGDLAGRVQALYGSPVDTEWVLSTGELYIVQARPLTALDRMQADPVVPADEVPINKKLFGGWREYWPEPTTPLDISLFIKSSGWRRDGLEIYGDAAARPAKHGRRAPRRTDRGSRLQPEHVARDAVGDPRPTAVPKRRSAKQVASGGRRIRGYFQKMGVSRIGSSSSSRRARLSPPPVARIERLFVFKRRAGAGDVLPGHARLHLDLPVGMA